MVRSSCERDRFTTRLLNDWGSSTHVLRLQGYLFFATGQDLLDSIKARIADTEAGPLAVLVLDLALVPSMDVTALRHFDKLRMLAEAQPFFVALCDTNDDIRDMLQPTCLRGKAPTEGAAPAPFASKMLFFDDLDSALEFGEECCIDAHGGSQREVSCS